MFGEGFAEAVSSEGATSLKAAAETSPDFSDSDSDVEDEQYDTDWDMTPTSSRDSEADGKQGEHEEQTLIGQAQDNSEPEVHQEDAGNRSQSLASSDPEVAPVLSGDEKDALLQASVPSASFAQIPKLGGQENDSKATQTKSGQRSAVSDDDEPRRSRTRVYVNDAAYSTYRAVLYYVCGSMTSLKSATNIPSLQVYTDKIYFAPLASSFIGLHGERSSVADYVSSERDLAQLIDTFLSTLQMDAKTRREWIYNYMKRHPNRNIPASAKAVYRLADSKPQDRLNVD